MPKRKLDGIDRRILMNLQENGRISNVNLARNAGISSPPCSRRVKALEEAGYIKGYFARIDPKCLGFGVTAFAQITLDNQSAENIKSFENLCNQWDMVRECCLVSGSDIDFIIRIVARNSTDYNDFINNQVKQAKGVREVKTMQIVRSAKEKHGVPL